MVGLVGLVVAACVHTPTDPPHADLVVLDAAITTMNPALPQATALAVRAGRIVYVGEQTRARAFIGPKTEVVHAAGHSVWPGLIDSHIHVMEGALARGVCSLGDAEISLEQAADKIRTCAAEKPGDDWLVVLDVNSANFRTDRRALDRVIADRPLFLWGADGHTGWVNSAGLSRAGITGERDDPEDGRIERDGAGMPSGFLVDGAVSLVTDAIPKPDAAARQLALSQTLPELHAAGITSFMEANADAATVACYVQLARAGGLSARVAFALGSNGANTREEFARLRQLRATVAAQPKLRADLIKLFADGVMEYPTQSAAMLAPYLGADGKPGTQRGRLYLEPDALAAFVLQADREAFGIHIHAIGDRAVRVGLDAFEHARANGSRRSYSMAHLQLIDPDDLPRFAALDVIASLQLLWALPDNYSVAAVLPYIGRERHARLYPAAALLAQSATVAGGSDWNVSSFNPFEAMAIAVSRRNPDKPELGTLGADQRVTLSAILTAYTINAARMLGQEQAIGALAIDKTADLIVLDRRLTDASSADEIASTRVLMTVIDGKVVFRANVVHPK